MKGNIFASIIAISCLILLTNCNQDSKYNELIIGKFYSVDYTEDIEWDEEIPISMTWEGLEEFFQDKTSIEEGKIKFSIYNENGNNIIIEYKYGPARLNWEIKDGKLYYDFGIPDIQLEYQSTNAKSYSEKEVVKYFREFIENDFTDIMKQFVVEEGGKPRKIIELNERRLVTEDNEGEQTIQKRII
jgi:hypothetical protein